VKQADDIHPNKSGKIMSNGIPFNKNDDIDYGAAQQMSPLVQRVVAENPSPFTFHGTGTFIVGTDTVAVIDPGPVIDSHIDAIMKAVAGRTVSHILVTHTHMDHSPAAAAIKANTGAPTWAFGPHGSGRPDSGGVIEEGGDHEFKPDHTLRHGNIIEGKGWTFEALHTPGHTSNHICFALKEEKTVFTGDHIMGWSTTIVTPPDGDMQAYMRSLDLLLPRDDVLYRPCHGPAIENPQAFVQAYIEHRQARNSQILQCLKDSIHGIPEMVERMYADVPAFLHPAAQRSVLAHLIHLTETGEARCDGIPELKSEYRIG
jgi:glyoxylase-like metal-dependent hydrolase (beta-lactamase superfamily II)